MAALDFPASPTLNQTYPSPAVPGVPVYTWDGEKWTTTGGAVGSTGAADDPPLMDGTASVGSSTQWAREDHRHPTDTAIAAGDALKVAKAGDTMTGDLNLVTPPFGDLSTKAASTAFVNYNNVIPSGVDLNTITAPGTYACSGSGNNPNEPTSGGQWYLHVWGYDANTDYIVQDAISLPNDPPVRYTRLKINGTWTQWVPVGAAAATAAEFIANSAPTKMLTPGAVWSAAAFIPTLTDGVTVTPDLATGFDFVWQIAGAGRTLANPLNIKPGQKGLIYIQQDATGGRTITTWGSSWKFPGGIKPTLTATAFGVDLISYWVLGGVLWCTFTADVR